MQFVFLLLSLLDRENCSVVVINFWRTVIVENLLTFDMLFHPPHLDTSCRLLDRPCQDRCSSA